MCISKQKLIQRLRQAYDDNLDTSNQPREMYQRGGNNLANLLLAEIAFGDLDADEGKR